MRHSWKTVEKTRRVSVVVLPARGRVDTRAARPHGDASAAHLAAARGMLEGGPVARVHVMAGAKADDFKV